MSDTPDLSTAVWVKSSYSSGDGGQCVEWAPTTVPALDRVPIRDSKDPEGPALLLTPAAFSSFIAAVQRNEFGEV